MRTIVSFLADMWSLAIATLRPVAIPVQRLHRLATFRSRADGHVPVTTQFDGPVRTAGGVKLRLGEHCRIGREVFFETRQNGHIEVGSHVRINRGSVIVSYSGISIGDNCLIGEYVSIRDADHGMRPGQLMRGQPHTTAPIKIGDDVWIGRGAAVLKGITIGSGAVIAANSVVIRDVPAMAVVGGAPARILRQRSANDKRSDVEGLSRAEQGSLRV